MSLFARRMLLTTIGVVCTALLTVVLVKPALLHDPEPPDSVEEQLAWLGRHPSDWLAAAAITDGALELRSPRRFELWRAAYAHARKIAPYRRNADVALVRSGLFHWAELGRGDRALVLRAAAPLMRDPQFFTRMNGPLLQLTHDFAWLRSNAPDTLDARLSLRNLAIERGRFADYRALRAEVREQRLEAMRRTEASAEPNVLVELLPEHLETADTPLVRHVLEALERQSFAPESISPRIDSLAGFALAHDVQPLQGLMPLVDSPGRLHDATRARVALRLGHPELATRIEITTAVPNDPDWQAYFVERALLAARAHDAQTANGSLARASSDGLSVVLLSAAEQVSTLLGKASEPYRQQLRATESQPLQWTGACGANELCTTVTTAVFTSDGVIRLNAETAQSDEIPPYLEIEIDDTLAAEGPVGERTTFAIPSTPGVHRLNVRLVNGLTRSGAQRRVRLS